MAEVGVLARIRWFLVAITSSSAVTSSIRISYVFVYSEDYFDSF